MTMRIRNDIIFIAVAVLVVSLLGLAFYFLRANGDMISVTVNGELYGEYPLGQERTVEITSNDGYNVLVIKDGAAYVEHASCPDGICAAHKPISRDGESIICLPNKVVVTVKISGGEETPDIIA